MSSLRSMLDRVVRELGAAGCVLRVELCGAKFVAEAWNPNTGDTIHQQASGDVADALGALSRDLRLHPPRVVVSERSIDELLHLPGHSAKYDLRFDEDGVWLHHEYGNFSARGATLREAVENLHPKIVADAAETDDTNKDEYREQLQALIEDTEGLLATMPVSATLARKSMQAHHDELKKHLRNLGAP